MDDPITLCCLLVLFGMLLGGSLTYAFCHTRSQWIVEIDPPYNYGLQDFFEKVEKFGGQIHLHCWEGPGGGNPMVTLVFKFKLDAEDFARNWFPDDPPEVFKAFC